MAAQKAAVGTAQGRRSDLGYSETQVVDAIPTLAEAGIDKNLADRARFCAPLKLRNVIAHAAKARQATGVNRQPVDLPSWPASSGEN